MYYIIRIQYIKDSSTGLLDPDYVIIIVIIVIIVIMMHYLTFLPL